MTLIDEYYDHVLDKKLADTAAKKILFEIIEDFTDRRGLRQGWEQIDEDIREEILSDWLDIIENNLQNA